MIEEKEFKVTIKENGHILYNGKIIALLEVGTNYWDLDPGTHIDKLRRTK